MADKKKSIFKSKTFWFQVLSMAAPMTGALPVSPDVAAIAVAAVNVGLRLTTTQPVSILSKP